MSTDAVSSTSGTLTEAQVIQLIGRALDVSPGNLAMTTKASDVPEWDSMGTLSILAALDRERIACETGNTAALQTVQGVIDVVRIAGRLQAESPK